MRKLIIILLAATLALSACSSARQKLSPQGNVDFKTAQVYYAQQNVEKAEEFYAKVLADNPDHALSMRRMADINLHKGENNPAKEVEYNQAAFELYDSALKAYQSWENLTDEEKMDIRDMTRRRDSAWVRVFAAGEKAYTDGNTKQAKEIFELSGRLDPERPQPMIRLKDIYLKDLKDPVRAEAILLQLVEKDPKSMPYLLETGAFYFNQENYTEAAKFFERAKVITPADIDNLLNLSFAYYELKDYDKALAATQMAMNLEPDNIDLIENAKNIALMKKDKQLAITYLEQLIDSRSIEADFSDITMLLNEVEDYSKLIKYAKKWYDWDDTSRFAVQYIILAAQKTGDDAMMKTYRDILKTMP
jgi:tetratricopeptide (TPR) repeat protein